MFKKCLVSILLIFLLMSIPVIGAPIYVNLGPLSYIGGDIGVPADKGYYIGDVLFSTAGLVDISTLVKTDGNFIVGDGTNWIVESGSTVRASLDIDLTLYYLKTEIDTLSEVETIYVKDITDSDELASALTDYYLKTAIDTIGEVETIWVKDIIDSVELAALKFTDLDDTPANYTGSSLKFARVNVGETALEFAAESDPTVDTDAEIKAILVNEVTKTGDFTAGRIAKINNATGIIEQGTNTDTEVSDAVTKKHTQNTDTDLDPTFEATFVKKVDTVNVLSDITSAGSFIEDAVTKRHTQNTDTALGTQTQDLNMGTHKIIGVVDPVNPQEAATKAYADTKVATEVDPTVDTDAKIKAILVDEITKTGTFTAGRLPEIDNSTGIIKQSDIEHKANGGYDFNINSAGFTTQTTTGDGTTTCDWRIGLKFRFLFGAQNETFTFTNPEFSCHLQIILIQDATGSRIVTWPAGIFWAGGTIPTLSTAANARDIVNLFFDDYDDVYYGMGADFAVP